MPEANKNEIKKAIKMLYGVTPVKVSVTQIQDKVVMRRGIIGKKSGGKKAVVYLKKGEKITFA
jgi:large subunit ribosomal protein L23